MMSENEEIERGYDGDYPPPLWAHLNWHQLPNPRDLTIRDLRNTYRAITEWHNVVLNNEPDDSESAPDEDSLSPHEAWEHKEIALSVWLADADEVIEHSDRKEHQTQLYEFGTRVSLMNRSKPHYGVVLDARLEDGRYVYRVGFEDGSFEFLMTGEFCHVETNDMKWAAKVVAAVISNIASERDARGDILNHLIERAEKVGVHTGNSWYQASERTTARLAELEAENARLQVEQAKSQNSLNVAETAVRILCERLGIPAYSYDDPDKLVEMWNFVERIEGYVSKLRISLKDTQADLRAANDELDANDARLFRLATMCDGETKLPDGTPYNAAQLLGEIREFVNEVSAERDTLLSENKKLHEENQTLETIINNQTSGMGRKFAEDYRDRLDAHDTDSSLNPTITYLEFVEDELEQRNEEISQLLDGLRFNGGTITTQEQQITNLEAEIDDLNARYKKALVNGKRMYDALFMIESWAVENDEAYPQDGLWNDVRKAAAEALKGGAS